MLCFPILFLTHLATAYARPLEFTRGRRAALDTGSCGSPEIEFANGLDGRNEPAFEPVNQKDFNHGSALNIGVISSFICQQLNDKCKASAATLAACTQAQTAASQATGGAAADAFNAALNIQSNFADVTASASSVAVTSATATAVSAAAATAIATSSDSSSNSSDVSNATASNTTANSSTPSGSNSSTSSLDFGSCKNPAIEFGPAFDGRKATENSFEPQDKTSINHDSALNIDIITQATCDQLKDNCKAPATTLTACAQGQKDADAQPKGTGAQADAFNAALGIQTSFATTPAAPGGGSATPAQALAASTPNIGSCANPNITFGIFDGRTEDSFEPADQTDFNHGSALNISIITQFNNFQFATLS
ncbi:hypothetical protein K439DRAFT_1638439 [Ramaria rubella]|nr:hypothetical protein K439DRAFT_1638439 [Ramaria rubella]